MVLVIFYHTAKSKAVGKDLRIPYCNFAVKGFAYDDHHDDMGFANYIFNELCSFGPGTVNIFKEMVGLPEAAYSKQEDDKSYLHSSSNNI